MSADQLAFWAILGIFLLGAGALVVVHRALAVYDRMAGRLARAEARAATAESERRQMMNARTHSLATGEQPRVPHIERFPMPGTATGPAPVLRRYHDARTTAQIPAVSDAT